MGAERAGRAVRRRREVLVVAGTAPSARGRRQVQQLVGRADPDVARGVVAEAVDRVHRGLRGRGRRVVAPGGDQEIEAGAIFGGVLAAEVAGIRAHRGRAVVRQPHAVAERPHLSDQAWQMAHVRGDVRERRRDDHPALGVDDGLGVVGVVVRARASSA